MKDCQNCHKPNRNEAKYCKWCGTLIAAAPQDGAPDGASLPEASDFIAKDNILPIFRSFAARCEHASEFMQLSGGTTRPGLDCVSSSVVRELSHFGKDVSALLPGNE